MKRLFLILLLLTAVLQGKPADASGSNTVFLPVKYSDYSFITATQDKAFNNSTLYNFLESSTNTLWVSRVSSYIYRSTYYYTYWGYDVNLEFADREAVTFRYYSNLDAILGLTRNDEIVVLLPQISSQTTPHTARGDTQ